MAYTSGSSSGSSTGSVGSSGGGCRESCGGGSCGGGCGGSLVRTVRLTRRPPPAKLGFSLRGGREHGTGFFVTAVETNSEAYHNGLMVGDQILRVNSFPVDDATHKEVLQLIQGQAIITLKVKAVGMIPVKENPEDELSWQIVDMVQPRCNGDLTPLLKQDICDDLRTPSDVRMVLRVPPRAKLGCGICKGPEWKPGVFVQFTKENGIARLAGLRPGDQILQCNNFIFTPDTPFNEAVAVMRCSGVLELIVRKGAGMELFPGESSGYNSSASSVAGDPPRLSALHEEAPINGSMNCHNTNDSTDHTHHIQSHNQMAPTANRPEYQNGCTVIHVGGNHDAVDNDSNHINNNVNSKKPQIAEICMVSQQLETKTTTVFVEVHHSEDDNVSHAQSDASTDRMTNSSSVSSFTSSASSLSSAISQELERRSKQRSPFVDPRERDKDARNSKPSEKLIKSGLAKEKVQQHEQLMEEFKKAHRKMFSSEQQNGDEHINSKEEREESRLSSSVAKKNDCSDSRMDVKSEPKTKRQSAPPPPPPFPHELEGAGEELRVPPPPLKPPSCKRYPAPTPPSQPPPPPSPPHCPTPDYDTASLAFEAVTERHYNNVNKQNHQVNGTRRNDGRTDKVEMQSLESFKLTNPSKVKPRPPSTYFTTTPSTKSDVSNSSTASTLPIKDRPVVLIREYPNGRERKNPTKFDFLQNVQPSALAQFDEAEPIACRLQNELSQTLSRVATLNREDIQSAQNNTNGVQPKGTIVTINVNHQQLTQGPKTEQTKPFYLFHNQSNGFQNDIKNGVQAQKISTMIQSAAQKSKVKNGMVENGTKNSVTFNFNHKTQEARNVTHSAPNGILKNNNVSHVQIQSQIDKMSPQKSIQFGGV